MQVANSKLILAIYLSLGLVCVVAVLGYVSQARQRARLSARWAELSRAAEQDARRPPVLLPRKDPPVSANEELDKLRQLRRSLESRTKMLDEQRKRLDRTTAEYERLDEENKRYIALLSEFILQDPANGVQDGDTSSSAPDEQIDAAASDELAMLQWELDEAERSLADLEIEQLRQREWSNALSAAVVDAGGLSVPVLIAMLAQQRSDLRVWAATLLGRIGPEAADALDALHVAADGNDTELGRAAAWAIEQIEPRL